MSGKVVNQQVVEKILAEKDKDLLIADLMLENAELRQRVEDVESILAEVMDPNA